MRGVPRPSAKVVPVVVNKQLLKAFDAIVPPMHRSKDIEDYMRRKVLRHKFGDTLPEAHLEEVLALID